MENPGRDWYENQSGYSLGLTLEPRISRGGAHEKFLLKYGSQLKGKSLLDVGCGAGEFLAEAKNRGAEVWGVDFDRSAVEVARSRLGLSNMYAMPLEHFLQREDLSHFDFVCCFEVIEHVDDPVSFAHSLTVRLKPDGLLVLSTPSRERMAVNLSAWDFPPHHLTRWNREALEKLFFPLGFRVINIEYLEQFWILLRAFHHPFRLRIGALGKAQNITSNKTVRLYLLKVLHGAGLAKRYIIGTIPACVLWAWGRLIGGKNGRMFVVLSRSGALNP